MKADRRQTDSPHQRGACPMCEPMPGAVESEKAILGLMLRVPDMAPEILGKVSNENLFAVASHRLIYRAIRDLHDEGRTPDAATVIDRLRLRGEIERASAAQGVSDLMDEGFPSLADQHCEQILEAGRRSRFMSILRGVSIRLHEGSAVGAVVDRLLSDVEQLRPQGSSTVGYAVVPLSQILKAPREIEWCVENLLPADGLGILSGESGCGKTWLILELALAVAKGEMWLGLFSTSKGPVLIIDQESGDRLLRRRLTLLGSEGEAPGVNILFSCFEEVRLDTSEGQSELATTIRAHKPRLVIIDSLVRVHSSDENAASEMKNVMGGLLRICRREQCAILLTHHARKEGRGSNAGGQRLRGSTELKAAVDLHLYARIGKDETIVVEHEKARFGAPTSTFSVRIQQQGAEAVVLWSKRSGMTKTDKARGIITDALSRAAKPVLKDDLENICKKHGISGRTSQSALGALVREGEIFDGWETSRTPDGAHITRRTYSMRAPEDSCEDFKASE